MKHKDFYKKWSQDEINDWLSVYSVLVLFEPDLYSNEAKINIHGKLSESQKNQLLHEITSHFGGTVMNRSICEKINEFAEKWHSKHILHKKARVINVNTKRRTK